MRRLVPLFVLLLGGLLPLVAAELPQTPKKPVSDTYHGVTVVDDYRWLEDIGNAEARQWAQAQNRTTRATLDKLPARKQILQRLKALFADATLDYTDLHYQGGRFFALSGGALVTLTSADDRDSEKELVDAEEVLNKDTATIHFFVPTRDGKHVAVCMSPDGRHEGSVHVYETTGAKKLPDVVPDAYTALGGSLCWNADGTGFYYTRWVTDPKPDANPTRYQQVYFHKLGTAAKDDTHVLGKEFSRLAGVGLEASDDGKHILATVVEGTGDNADLFLLGPNGTWAQLARRSDKIAGASFGPDGALYILSRKDTPRGKAQRLPLATLDLRQAETVVPQGEGVLSGFVATKNRYYVVEYRDGTDHLRMIDRTTRAVKSIPLKPFAAVPEFTRLDGDEVLFRTETYFDPPAWYRIDPATGQTKRTELFADFKKVSFDDTEVVRAVTASKDGTKVPLTILRRKGLQLDGKNPTFLTGYGGYNHIEVPEYHAHRRIWLEQGGVWAIAHLRGDGDFGEDWHKDGIVTKKQNTFDDFGACLQYLIDAKYTSPERLAIEGSSNGGLLVGAAVTQYPERFRAAVSRYGTYDLLRDESFPNGVFDIHEQGTVKIKEQFAAMYAYSPYHRVRDGTAYPATLLVTGIHDRRVYPGHSWKLAARLQAATSSKLPVLLWTGFNSGHGASTFLENLGQEADVFAFLFHHLGVTYKPMRGK